MAAKFGIVALWSADKGEFSTAFAGLREVR